MLMVTISVIIVMLTVQLNVGAHKEVSGREQWADLEKEEEEEAVIEESLSEEEEESDSWEEEEESDQLDPVKLYIISIRFIIQSELCDFIIIADITSQLPWGLAPKPDQLTCTAPRIILIRAKI